MPNIAIYEGGKAARMNGVSVITTDDGDGGKVEWVPQSQRQTGTLHVSQNGTYRAEDEGLHSWSKVTVRLAGAPTGMSVPTLPDPITGVETPTGEIGLEEPVPPAGLEPIEDEPISTDEAKKILEDAGLDTSDLDPDSPNYDDAMEAIGDALGTDPDNVKVVDPEKKEDVKKEQPKTKGEGQKITGTNPETGDTETIGINPDGTVDKEEAIAEIRLYTDPSKLMYHDGESIDFTGMEFAAYSASGRLLKVFPWPDPKIVTPVTKADMNEASDIDVRYNGITIRMMSEAFAGAQNTDFFFFFQQNATLWAYRGGGFVVLFAEPEPTTVQIDTLAMAYHMDHGVKVYDTNEWSFPQVSVSDSFTYAGKTVYYTTMSYSWYPPAQCTGNGSVPDEAKELGQGMTAWIMIYGDYKRGVQKIPVSYDGFEDYFEIWVS